MKCFKKIQKDWENVTETTLHMPRLVKKEQGGRCSKHWNRGSPETYDEDHGEAAIEVYSGGSHTRAGGYSLNDAATSWKVCARASFWPVKDL